MSGATGFEPGWLKRALEAAATRADKLPYWMKREPRRASVPTTSELEQRIIDYFRAKDCDVEHVGLEWFLSLYDEGPAISLTGLAIALSNGERP
jgi:hypothetical protein